MSAAQRERLEQLKVLAKQHGLLEPLLLLEEELDDATMDLDEVRAQVNQHELRAKEAVAGVKAVEVCASLLTVWGPATCKFTVVLMC